MSDYYDEEVLAGQMLDGQIEDHLERTHTTHYAKHGIARHPAGVTCVYCVEDGLDSCPQCGSETIVVRAEDDGWLVECVNRHCDHALIVPDVELSQPAKK